MSKIYYLKYYDDLIGTITYPDCIFKLDNSYKEKDIPAYLFHGSKTPTKEEVLDFLKLKVVQEDNQGIDVIMHELGYPIYDIEVLLDATYGMQLDDPLWLLPEDKLYWDYKNYHIQANPARWMADLSDNNIKQMKSFE